MEPLPLPLEALPESLRRFCNPQGPAPARMMAAKGLVPVKGNDLVLMLCQLSADTDPQVAETAKQALAKLPAQMTSTACAGALPPAALDHLASIVKEADALGELVRNESTADLTLERLATQANEALCERIATNESRLLQAPRVIEALYKNRNTRMSTADRIVELAARNHLELSGIPAFAAHVEALQGQLIAQPSEAPLPQDEVFSASLAEDPDDTAFEQDKYTGAEALNPRFKPLTMQILDMTKAEKIRLAQIGNAAARAILVRDNDRQVAFAAISSPQLTLAEACDVARSREVTEEILRYIALKKDWIKSGELKHNLAFNPKTPVGLSMRFLGHLRLDELRKLSRSRNVPAQLRSLAAQWVVRKQSR